MFSRLISWNPDDEENENTSNILVPLNGSENDTSEAQSITSVEMLANVVKEGRTHQCSAKADTFFSGRNLMAGPIQGRDGDILGVCLL